MKLGIGDYYFTCYDNPNIIHAQLIFWDTIMKKAPEVIEDIKANVFKEYEKVKNYPFESLRISYHDFVFNPDKFYTIYKNAKFLEPFRQSLFDWSLKYNLVDEWLLGKAFRTLFYLSNAEFFKYNTDINTVSFTIGWFAENQFSEFKFKPWNPLMETWDKYKKQLEAALGNYKNNIEEMVKGKYKKAEVIRKPEQFEWIVRFQVQNWSLSRIALNYFSIDPKDMDYKTIMDSKKAVLSKQLHALADMVGLTLRTDIEDD